MVKTYRRAKHVICNHPGCRVITEGVYCQKHDRHPTKPRSERDKFLDSVEWRRLSAWQLQREPCCQQCAKAGRVRPATDADHIQPRHSHPHLALDPSNLQSLCKTCHGKKTKAGE